MKLIKPKTNAKFKLSNYVITGGAAAFALWLVGKLQRKPPLWRTAFSSFVIEACAIADYYLKMAEQSIGIARRLLTLMQETGYPLVQHNGQRRFGPPPNWNGPPPERGSEVFVGKLPREIFEDELIPVLSSVGKIYELRLMMDFSGSNRGYAFVTYSNKAEAHKAVKELNNYEIQPGRHIGVVKSVDNSRLFVGRIPKNKTKEDIHKELANKVDGIVNVILYKNCFNRSQNRGFAFVEFVSHRAAAMARRVLVPGCVTLWGQEVTVDWAEPEPDIDDEQMKKVKVLHVRNFLVKTSPDTIKSVFEAAISDKIERVKKICDYAFIHFYKREHAERAMLKMQNAQIDGANIEIRWAKPVDREIYRIQKLGRGNAKFTKSFDLSQTLRLYKEHKNKVYATCPKEDKGIDSAYAGSVCDSEKSKQSRCYKQSVRMDQYNLPPAKLEALCKRYMWAPPIYDYQQCIDYRGVEFWVCKLELPEVGKPLCPAPMPIGPLLTGACFTLQEATTEAATTALQVIQSLMPKSELMHQSSPVPIQPYTSMMQSMQVPYPYIGTPTSVWAQQVAPLTVPAYWPRL